MRQRFARMWLVAQCATSVLYRSSTSIGDRDREQHRVNGVFNACSSCVMYMSLCSRMPSSTSVRHDPQIPVSQEV